MTANLASGSHMVNNASTDTSPNGWGFGTPSGGTFNGQHYGIEAFGGTRTLTLRQAKLSAILPTVTPRASAGLTMALSGRVMSPARKRRHHGQPFEQTAEVFHFTVPSTFDVSQISNVSFQYGTNNGEAAFPPTKASPAISTSASKTADGVVGTAVLSDSATVTGGFNVGPAPGHDHLHVTAAGRHHQPGGITVTSQRDGTYNAPATVPATEVGTYTWHASYSGNSLNNGAIANGTNESVTTVKASPAISHLGQQDGRGVVGTTVLSDSATVTGGYQPDRHDHLHRRQHRTAPRAWTSHGHQSAVTAPTTRAATVPATEVRHLHLARQLQRRQPEQRGHRRRHERVGDDGQGQPGGQHFGQQDGRRRGGHVRAERLGDRDRRLQPDRHDHLHRDSTGRHHQPGGITGPSQR